MLEHAVEALKSAGISKLIMVIGYEAERLMEFVHNNIEGIEIEFVINSDYATTNNIYSLYRKEYLTKDDTILLESDLIFEPGISDIVNMHDENV